MAEVTERELLATLADNYHAMHLSVEALRAEIAEVRQMLERVLAALAPQELERAA